MRTREGRFLAFAMVVLLAVSPLMEGFAAGTSNIEEGTEEEVASSTVAAKSDADPASPSDSTELTDEENQSDSDLASSSDSSYLIDGEIQNDIEGETASPADAEILLTQQQLETATPPLNVEINGEYAGQSENPNDQSKWTLKQTDWTLTINTECVTLSEDDDTEDVFTFQYIDPELQDPTLKVALTSLTFYDADDQVDEEYDEQTAAQYLNDNDVKASVGYDNSGIGDSSDDQADFSLTFNPKILKDSEGAYRKMVITLRCEAAEFLQNNDIQGEVEGEGPSFTGLEPESATVSGITGSKPREGDWTTVQATKVWLQSDGSVDDGDHPEVWFQLWRKVTDANGVQLREEPAKIANPSYDSTEEASESNPREIDVELKELPEENSVVWDHMPLNNSEIAESDDRTTWEYYEYFVKEVDADGVD